MSFSTTERLEASSSEMVRCGRLVPFNWQQMADQRRLTVCASPMAAGQADCSYLADFRLFRYFIFADGNRTGDNWA
jgi:hypothetical protein